MVFSGNTISETGMSQVTSLTAKQNILDTHIIWNQSKSCMGADGGGGTGGLDSP